MADCCPATTEIYDAYRRSRQKARAFIKHQLTEVLDFLEEEEALFDEAARKIGLRSSGEEEEQ